MFNYNAATMFGIEWGSLYIFFLLFYCSTIGWKSLSAIRGLNMILYWILSESILSYFKKLLAT